MSVKVYPSLNVCFGSCVESKPLLDALLLSGVILGIEGVLQDEAGKATRMRVLLGSGELLAEGQQERGLEQIKKKSSVREEAKT